MKNLGVMYEKGQGVGKDMAQAGVWFRRAAEVGNAKAQRNLGHLYLDGLLGVRDDAKVQLVLGQVLSRSSSPDDQVEPFARLSRAEEGFQDAGLKRQAASLRQRIRARLTETQRRSVEKILETYPSPQ
jgi:TPR repeat protein